MPTSQSKFTFPKRVGLSRTLVRITGCSYTLVRLNALSLYIYLQQPQTQTLLHLFVKTSFGLVFIFTHVNGNWCKKHIQFYWITAFLFSCLIYCNRETVRLKTDLGENHTYQWTPAPKFFSTENSLELLASNSKRCHNIPTYNMGIKSMMIYYYHFFLIRARCHSILGNLCVIGANITISFAPQIYTTTTTERIRHTLG